RIDADRRSVHEYFAEVRAVDPNREGVRDGRIVIDRSIEVRREIRSGIVKADEDERVVECGVGINLEIESLAARVAQEPKLEVAGAAAGVRADREPPRPMRYCRRLRHRITIREGDARP